MGNMCCRRVVGYSPNGVEVEAGRFQPQQSHQQGGDHQQQKGVISPMYHMGDDCAINELLEGRMDLDVILPDSRKVRLTVERRTPMMDLLVQAASANKISPAGHTIHVFGDNGKGGTLHYKPSTPIGSLDANTICIVPKKDAQDSAAGKRAPKTANRPFEPTFRVQVHLPRNQLTVTRVSPRVTISELRTMVCQEKGLDTSRYQLVRPSDPGQPLSGDITLAEYGSTEITLLSNTCIESHICNSTSHIMSYPKRAEEQKRKTGILRLLAEDANHKFYKKTQSNTASTNIQPLLATQKSTTEAPHKPKKRRPAPPPPPPVLPEPPFHSRQSSSDSSGYHEATSSYLREEHCVSVDEKASSDSSGVSSLDAKVSVTTTKKRKAPLPPSGGGNVEVKGLEGEVQEISRLQYDVQDTTKEESIESTPQAVEECVSEIQREECPTVDATKKTVELSETHVPKDDGTVTKVALVALNARIEQDVTGQEIASSIQAAFHSLECAKPEPSLLAIKRRDGPVTPSTDGLNNDAFDSAKKSGASIDGLTSVTNGLSNYCFGSLKEKCEFSADRQNSSVNGLNKHPHDSLKKSGGYIEEQTSSTSAGKELSNYCFGTLKKQCEPSVDKQNLSANGVNNHSFDSLKKSDYLSSEPQSSSTGLNNHCPGIFKNSLEKDISREGLKSANTSNKSINLQISSVRLAPKETTGYHKSCVNVNVGNISRKTTTESSLDDISDNSFQIKKVVVSLKPETSSVSKSPNSPISITSNVSRDFNERCLTPEKSIPSCYQSTNSIEDTHSNFYPLQKSSVRLNFEPKDGKEDHIETFLPPPTEFRSVDNNETPLPKSHPTPSKTLRRSSSLLNLANLPPPAKSNRVRHLQRSLSDLSIDDKGEFEAEQERLQREYVKLQRQFILWQQQLMSNHAMLSEECLVPQYARTLRQSHSLPEGEDYSDESSTSCPLVSRSLSYEPTKDRSSTLPRSTINIPSLLEFGSTTTINNGTSTLRSSKTKSYFKPPQVRISTKNRQRLPPEIRKDGDVDNYDDTKILSTILPSFDSLKLISENEDSDSTIAKLKNNQPLTRLETLRNSRNQKDTTVLHLKNNSQVTKLENLLNGDDSGTTVLHLKKGPKLESQRNGQNSNGLGSQRNNGQNSIGHGNNSVNLAKKNEEVKKIPPPVPNKTSSLPKHIFGQSIGNGHCPNGDTGQARVTTKVNGHTVPSDPPPPPPPLPVNGQVNGKSNNKVVSGPQRKMVEKKVDSREQLMQEIRKCGGRTALRKISLT